VESCARGHQDFLAAHRRTPGPIDWRARTKGGRGCIIIFDIIIVNIFGFWSPPFAAEVSALTRVLHVLIFQAKRLGVTI
jgi:hypothetical protein